MIMISGPASMEVVGISDDSKHVLFDVHNEEVAFDFFVRMLELRMIERSR